MEDWSRQFETLCRQRMAQEREPGSAFADLQPVFLFLDPGRFGADPGLVPALTLQRFRVRPIRRMLSFAPDDPELDPFMDPWQRRQFRELGYALTVLVHLPFQITPRGRRALAPVELALREALQLWTFALIPAIEAIFSRSKALKSGYASPFDCLAQNAPHLLALAERSRVGQAADEIAAERPDDAEDHPALREFVRAQADEGRKHRLVITGEGSGSGGDCEGLRQRQTARAVAACGTSAEIRRRIELLDLLAKARRAAAAIMSDRPGEMRDYTEGMERLDGLGAHDLRRDPAGQGKRRLAAANVINAAQKPDALIQPPIPDAAIRFSPQELAALAFFCDIDPFHICAQHHLLCPEILAARALGAAQFQRREVEREAVEPLMPWLRISGAPRHGDADPIETGARDIAATIISLRKLLIED